MTFTKSCPDGIRVLVTYDEDGVEYTDEFESRADADAYMECAAQNGYAWIYRVTVTEARTVVVA